MVAAYRVAAATVGVAGSVAAYRVAVLGAGVAGSVCASRLAQLPDVHTTVYDMGARGPGGRACSRSINAKGGTFSPADRGGASSLSPRPSPSGVAPPRLTFDHGVQAFAVSRDDAVRALVEGWERDGHVARWDGRFGVVDARTGAFEIGTHSDDDDDAFGLLAATPLFVGIPSMGGLARGMLESARERAADGATLELRFGCKATRVTHAREGHGLNGRRWEVVADLSV